VDTAGCEILVSQKARVQDYTTHGKGTGIYPIDDRAKISIAGDWGTGTDEARIVAATMEKSDPDFTIHLGDVYYVGDGNGNPRGIHGSDSDIV
jgi:hypothetical protein